MRMPKATAIEKLNRSISQIDDLKKSYDGSPEFSKWHRDTEIAIENIFEPQSRHIKDFNDIEYTPSFSFSGMADAHYIDIYRAGLENARAVLQSMIDEIAEYWSNINESDADSVKSASQTSRDLSPGGDIFVIHGHDTGFKETVARFLGRLGLNPVILHEQASEGKTIIEKFEKHAANARFAIALFSPDDFG